MLGTAKPSTGRFGPRQMKWHFKTEICQLFQLFQFVNNKRLEPNNHRSVFRKFLTKMPHDHHHHGGGCVHESSDSDYLKEIGIQYSLYTKIDMENLECLNETVDGSAKMIFKPYEERLNFDKVSWNMRQSIGLFSGRIIECISL